MRVFIERVGLLLLVFACASLLHYYGGLRFEAAWFIGGAFTLIAMWLYILKEIAMFKPYRLIIGINYGGLWEDLKLAPADGPKFENFTFRAISAAVFVRSDERQYSTKLDLYEQIPCGAATWTPGIGDIRNGPAFFFRPGRDGYQFGLHVQEEWWKLHSQQLAAALRDLPLSYGNDIVLGLLPDATSQITPAVGMNQFLFSTHSTASSAGGRSVCKSMGGRSTTITQLA
jgi:hypothetical protein